jgi:hypothetical protein
VRTYSKIIESRFEVNTKRDNDYYMVVRDTIVMRKTMYLMMVPASAYAKMRKTKKKI